MCTAKPIISKHALERLVRYLTHLKTITPAKGGNISATAIAEALELNQVQVRKDLACVSNGGKPKTGYVLADLITDLERFLNYDSVTDAVLLGVGNLGRALMAYTNFSECGLNIVAGFDINPQLIGTEINGKKIFHLNELGSVCHRLNIHIGIIAVPCSQAQAACDLMAAYGIRAIWNFSSANLSVPARVVVKNESMTASFVVLSQMLTQNLAAHGSD
jgi:redox-sensing transcriptional repressor